jgi:Domain of unknown function (DUF5664)
VPINDPPKPDLYITTKIGPAYLDPKTIQKPFAGGGVREDQTGRPRFELLVPLGVPFEEQLLTRCAVHMAKGASKYADRNWESFSDDAALERAKAAAFRHFMQWMTSADDGEDHAAAVVFNLMAAEHVRAKMDKVPESMKRKVEFYDGPE